MAGRRKVKMDGVVQIILLKRVEVWIINIKPGSVEQPAQEIINKAEIKQRHQLHELHHAIQWVVLQQTIHDQGLQDQVERVTEEEEGVVVVDVKSPTWHFLILLS